MQQPHDITTYLKPPLSPSNLIFACFMRQNFFVPTFRRAEGRYYVINFYGSAKNVCVKDQETQIHPCIHHDVLAVILI